MPSELENIKVGDEVAIFSARGDKLRRIETVEWVTLTTIVAGGVRYQKFTGYSAGKMGLARPATAEHRAAIAQKETEFDAAKAELERRNKEHQKRRHDFIVERTREIRAALSLEEAVKIMGRACVAYQTIN